MFRPDFGIQSIFEDRPQDRIVERASGTHFTDSTQQKVFAPLGLDRTTMDPTPILAEKNRAIGHFMGLARLPADVDVPTFAPWKPSTST